MTICRFDSRFDSNGNFRFVYCDHDMMHCGPARITVARRRHYYHASYIVKHYRPFTDRSIGERLAYAHYTRRRNTENIVVLYTPLRQLVCLVLFLLT